MRISDWSSDVCSSDLDRTVEHDLALDDLVAVGLKRLDDVAYRDRAVELAGVRRLADQRQRGAVEALGLLLGIGAAGRREESRVGEECGRTCRYRVTPFH